MSERDHYIPGVPCWVDTTQPDPAGSLDFYRRLFGWELENVMPAEAPAQYFMARVRGGDVAAIGSLPDGMPRRAAWNTYVAVASADDAAAKVRDAGGRVLTEPFDVMRAGRTAVVSDPEGAVLSVWEARDHIGARVVNGHGALNFNVLNTRDPEGAKAFYGAVFGWTTLTVGGGTMWTLAGYGDDLERATPGLRQMTADMGGPEGFVDVVASIQPLGPDQPDVPARWSVMFGIDDADAAAATATELGGTVLTAPFDAPWSRMTVLSDPQGATFIASQFVPENKDLGRRSASDAGVA